MSYCGLLGPTARSLEPARRLTRPQEEVASTGGGVSNPRSVHTGVHEGAEGARSAALGARLLEKARYQPALRRNGTTVRATEPLEEVVRRWRWGPGPRQRCSGGRPRLILSCSLLTGSVQLTHSEQCPGPAPQRKRQRQFWPLSATPRLSHGQRRTGPWTRTRT